MTTLKVGDTAAIACDPRTSDGREQRLVVVESVDADTGLYDVLTLEPAPQRLTGLKGYDSRQDLEDSDEQDEARYNINRADKPLKDEGGKNREADFYDALPWANGVFPVEQPKAPAPRKRAAKKATEEPAV